MNLIVALRVLKCTLESGTGSKLRGGLVSSAGWILDCGRPQAGHRELAELFAAFERAGPEGRAFAHLRQMPGLLEAVGEFYAEAAWQRCLVHFYRTTQNQMRAF